MSNTDYHEGRPWISECGKGRDKMIVMHCPYGHVAGGIPATDFAGSMFEANAADPNFTVRCYGTLPPRKGCTPMFKEDADGKVA